MKKALATLLIAAMTLGLVACGGTQNSQQENNQTPSTEQGTADVGTEENVTITYCNFNASGGNEATLNAMYEKFHEELKQLLTMTTLQQCRHVFLVVQLRTVTN